MRVIASASSTTSAARSSRLSAQVHFGAMAEQLCTPLVPDRNHSRRKETHSLLRSAWKVCKALFSRQPGEGGGAGITVLIFRTRKHADRGYVRWPRPRPGCSRKSGGRRGTAGRQEAGRQGLRAARSGGREQKPLPAGYPASGGRCAGTNQSRAAGVAWGYGRNEGEKRARRAPSAAVALVTKAGPARRGGTGSRLPEGAHAPPRAARGEVHFQRDLRERWH